MSTSDIPIVRDDPEGQGVAEIEDPQRLDAEAAKSEETGEIPQSEVEDLKDSIGGGEVLDDSPGIKTRGVKVDAMKQEKEIDSVDLGE